MGRFARDPGGGDFEKPEPGTYKARCYRVIDLGTQSSGNYKPREKVMIGWELVGTHMEADGRPFSVHQRYSNSLHEKARLRNDLEAWRGRAFTDEELEGFDLAKLLNVPCRLLLVQDGDYVNVKAIMALDKGEEVPPLQNETVTFFLDQPDWDVFKSLSDSLQKTIAASPEYKRILSPGDEEDTAPSDDEPPPPDDDSVPF